MKPKFYIFNVERGGWYNGRGGWTREFYKAFEFGTLESAKVTAANLAHLAIQVLEIKEHF